MGAAATFCYPPSAAAPEGGERQALGGKGMGSMSGSIPLANESGERQRRVLRGEGEVRAGLRGLKGAFKAIKTPQVREGKETGAGGPLARQ